MRIVTAGNPSGSALSGLITRMRPTRDRRGRRTPSLRVTLVVTSALVACACGRAAVSAGGAAPAAPSSPLSAAAAAAPAAPLVVVIGEPTAPGPAGAPEAASAATAAASDTDAQPETFPKTWSGPIVPSLSFADAMGKARSARDAHGRLVLPPASASEAAIRQWFTQSQGLADQASRMFAAAFHATDATREGRIDAIAEAAELDMAMARRLEDAGLATMPSAWRSDPSVASTFEDIAVGPTRRWRDEARVLARQCIETAREDGVLTDAAKRCALLRTGAPVKVARRGADAGAPCACSAGDPLCSASLGGWCAATRP